jgi:hypothetical protein
MTGKRVKGKVGSGQSGYPTRTLPDPFRPAHDSRARSACRIPTRVGTPDRDDYATQGRSRAKTSGLTTLTGSLDA